MFSVSILGRFGARYPRTVILNGAQNLHMQIWVAGATAAPAEGHNVAIRFMGVQQLLLQTRSQQALGIATQSTLVADVQTAIKGGSFLANLETDTVSSFAGCVAIMAARQENSAMTRSPYATNE